PTRNHARGRLVRMTQVSGQSDQRRHIMRSKIFTLTALSLSVGLGIFGAGCKEERAESAYHPSPAAWYGYNPSSVDGSHAAKPTNVAPKVESAAADEPGTTRTTAGTGGIGGGP